MNILRSIRPLLLAFYKVARFGAAAASAGRRTIIVAIVVVKWIAHERENGEWAIHSKVLQTAEVANEGSAK